MPRFAPVIKIVFFSMFIQLSFLWFFFESCLFRHWLRCENSCDKRDLPLPCFGFWKVHLGTHIPPMPSCPAAHASEWSDDCRS